MNRHYLTSCICVCLLCMATNVLGQTSPIDEFLKKYPSSENVTNVSVSQQMLQSIFVQAAIELAREEAKTKKLNTPEAYKSITIKSTTAFNDFKKLPSFAKYEEMLSVDRGNTSHDGKNTGSNLLGYYMKKADKGNEILLLRQQSDRFSAIFIKGEGIDITNVDVYLRYIRTYLAGLNTSAHGDLSPVIVADYGAIPFPPYHVPLTLDFNESSFNVEIFKEYMTAPQIRLELKQDSIMKIQEKALQEAIKYYDAQ